MQSPGLAEPVNLRSRKFLFFQRSMRSWARGSRAASGAGAGAGAAMARVARRVVRRVHVVRCILKVGFGGWLGLWGLDEVGLVGWVGCLDWR